MCKMHDPIGSTLVEFKVPLYAQKEITHLIVIHMCQQDGPMS